MKEYFTLQFRMAGRKIQEAGVHPLAGALLGIVVFVLISAYLYRQTTFAGYLLVMAAVSVFAQFSEKKRDDFLRLVFGDSEKRTIRLLENLIAAIPFVLVLLYKQSFIETAVLLVLCILTAITSLQTTVNRAIPTPFSKTPFEFTVGFRRSFYMFPAAYVLTAIALSVGNFNLGIFAMLLIFFTVMTYYTESEHEYYVWTFADTPNTFLIRKLKQAAQNTLLLSIPVLIALLVYYPQSFAVILGFFLIGNVFTGTVLLAKYAAYPRNISMVEGTMITLSIFFPPLLLVIIPLFVYNSLKKLKPFLHDKN